MKIRGFTERELRHYRELGLRAIEENLVSGFNYYPTSIERNLRDSVLIPIKYAHRESRFLNLLRREVQKRFNGNIKIEQLPRKVIYR